MTFPFNINLMLSRITRVTTLNNQTSTGGIIAGYAYGYDLAGNVIVATTGRHCANQRQK
jgi:hypothetical protein